MSGYSVSVTVPCGPDVGRRVLAAQKPGEAPHLQGLPDGPVLFASSHRNWVDGALARLVRATGATGLDHLATPFDPRTGHALGHGPWATLLEGDDLACLVTGTQALLARLRATPALLATATLSPCEPERLADALHVPASTVDEAIAIYQSRRDFHEGDDLHCLVAFLQAHAALAWQARNEGLALFHLTRLH